MSLPLSRRAPLRRRALRGASRATLLLAASAAALAASSANASAAGRPIVTVASAPVITASDATVSARVTANGWNATTRFQFGTSTAYGQSINSQTVGWSSTQNVTAKLTGLTPGVTYHYRAVANNIFGTTYGPSQSFVFGQKPTVTLGSRPRATGDASITDWILAGKVNGNGLATTARIEFGATSSYGSTGATFTVSPSGSEILAIAESSPGATIHYRVVATNAAGTTYGAPRTFVVPAKLVRPVYLYPSDRAYRSDYASLIIDAMRQTQEFYAREAGKTFSMPFGMPKACAMPNTATYYGSRDPITNAGSWQKVDAALTDCLGAARNQVDIVAYADIPSTCSSDQWDRLGGGTDNLTIMGENDLKGLNGQTGMIDPCSGVAPPEYGVKRWVGGLAHEVGHSFGLDHPDAILATCPSGSTWTSACQRAYSSLMYVGYIDGVETTYLLDVDKQQLQTSPYFS